MAGSTAILRDGVVALPRHRRPDGRGHLVAEGSHDEDVVTMAAGVALALADRHDDRPTALLLATVSGPFAEGGSAQVVAEVLGLHDLFVLESAGSVAAGGAALATACAMAAAGTGPVMVVAADRRRDHRGRPLGDAAVALLVDADDGGADGDHAARITHVGSTSTTVRDRWRRDGEAAVTSAERSLATHLGRATPDLDDPTVRVAASPVTTSLARVGEAGCAAFLLALLRDLDRGDGDAVVRASGVAHRFAFAAGPAAARVARGTRTAIADGVDEPAGPAPSVAGFDPYASQARSWRERAQDLRLEGQRDPATGEVFYPPVPDATAAGLEPFRLARRGQVVTMTRDHIVPLGPPLSMAVVELDGGGRFYGPVVDGREVAIGDRVTLVLRRLHDGGGLPQWFWKVRPEAPSPVGSPEGDPGHDAGHVFGHDDHDQDR